MSIGQRVAVHNYHVGEFLESWNGETGIVVKFSSDLTYIQLDGYHEDVSAIGFPHENILLLRGELAKQPAFVSIRVSVPADTASALVSEGGEVNRAEF